MCAKRKKKKGAADTHTTKGHMRWECLEYLRIKELKAVINLVSPPTIKGAGAARNMSKLSTWVHTNTTYGGSATRSHH